jgi:hypothetical protein
MDALEPAQTLRKSHNRLSRRLCEQSRLLSSAASFGAQPAQFSPEISQSLRGTGIAPVAFLAQITPRGATGIIGPPARRVRANCQRRRDEKAIGFGR